MVGVVVASAIALARGTSVVDALILVLVSAGGALVAAICGWWALGPLRRATVRSQAVAVAVLVVVSTTIGVMAAAQAMFISAHDLSALMVVLIAAGSAGAAAASRLGSRVDVGSRAVEDLAGRIGDGCDPPVGGPQPATAELARLAERITSVSAELERTRRREQGLENSRRELIAWISHDLRGPLTSIRAMAEALEEGVADDPETIARYHTATRSETERLARMVDDLFELSRITAGATKLRHEQVPLAVVLNEAVDTVEAQALGVGVGLERRYLDLPVIRVAVGEFIRVLHNLLDNAIRHTPPGGTVTVSAGVDDQGAGRIVVQDECGGIPIPDLDRVFDLAFRGDNARGRDGGGGFGLTIAKGLVEAHHGQLGVDNKGSGCRFTVTLPPEPLVQGSLAAAPETRPAVGPNR